MKLERTFGGVAVLAALLVVGCASTPPVKVAQAPASGAVGTTELMAADVVGAGDASPSAKTHREALVEANDAKGAAPEHRADRKPGGGFSGYK